MKVGHTSEFRFRHSLMKLKNKENKEIKKNTQKYHIIHVYQKSQ